MNDAPLNIAPTSAIPRGEHGLFIAGGPGRPKGARGKKSREALDQIKSFGPEALIALRGAIGAGERWAVEFCLSKIVPSNARTIEWEHFSIDDVVSAFTDGDISTVEFRDIVSGIVKLSELTELSAIKAKLVALEQYLDVQK